MKKIAFRVRSRGQKWPAAAIDCSRLYGLSYLASPDLSEPRREAWMSCKSVLQNRQFLPEQRQRKKSFNIGLPDLPDRRRKEAMHFELIKLED
jgi:hypothetical protein